ncbi:MAG: hypothetical protein U0165_19855 [Polyangiaceae bacterium]
MSTPIFARCADTTGARCASRRDQEFASGKAEGFQREGVVKSPALTTEQQQILEARGVLSPEEIHKLASKTRKAVGADQGKGSCHSDFAEAPQAQRVQEKLVKLRLNADAE